MPRTRLISIDDRVVGWVSVRCEADHREIGDLHILPAEQRQGLGRQVVAGIIEEAAPLPDSLDVLKLNPARSLYERLGFGVIGETATHLIMKRPNAERAG